MEMYLAKLITIYLMALTMMPFLSNGRDLNPSFKIKAVNLGGWLVTEGWIKPSLFDAIPNNDLLDGTGLQFKSVTVNKYLCAESGGGTKLVANRAAASGWETFSLWRINEITFNLRVFNKQFAGLANNGNGKDVVAVSKTPGSSETFEIVRKQDDPNRVRIKAPNGLFLQVQSEDSVTADYGDYSNWGDNDPSVFIISITGGLQGEFQVTNGYGPKLAPQVMREHWENFIVEEDFKFISKHGINAVRIPVGWWIAKDPTPPSPYAGGSLQMLDYAFQWAEKYNLKVIIDLHAAPGSQNGFEHSSSRDGSLEWGTDETIQQTVDVIDFLTARYTKSPSLYAVELLNEPLAPTVAVDKLTKYYRAAYNAVRKYSSTVYVVMSNRIGPVDPKELHSFASGFSGSVIDVHYYNLFWDIFDNMNAQQNLDFINQNRSGELNYITTSDGPLIFVGEWVAEWKVSPQASRRDYQRFAQAQLDVYGRASFGWAYWCLKHERNHWNLEWMINYGYIKP